MTVSSSPQFHFERILAFPRAGEVPLPPRVFKRATDLAVCILMLPCLLVVIPFIAILIAIESSGPPIFVQERVGYEGKRFRIYKFRTLVHKRNDQMEREFMKDY